MIGELFSDIHDMFRILANEKERPHNFLGLEIIVCY
jgi:hypothetical protein